MKSAVQSNFFSANTTLNIRGNLLDLASPVVMGILNVTPDSFFDGGSYNSELDILRHTEKMLQDGAAIIDVGGYSSRPGADHIDQDEEMKRAISAVKSISMHFPEALLSIDTFRSKVAYAAIQEGAGMVNDISAGNLDKAMISTVAKLKVPYILMHMKGTPQTMKKEAHYENLIKEIGDYFHSKIAACQEEGIKDIILDPGFGFAKTIDQNFELLNTLEYFKFFGKPILVGLSRKSMIWKTLGIQVQEALPGTLVLNTIATLKGAQILRVHDVKEAVQTLRLLSHLTL